MMMGLFINKESLDNNMNLIRETLKQKIEVINHLQEQLTEYSNLDSTSQAIEVLKTYAKEDIYNNFNQMVEVFNSIINKTYLIQDRYEQLCGNCSLDEEELEENINKLNKVIKIVENVKYNLDYIDLFDTLPFNQYIINLNDLKQMYQNKLDGLLEFNQYTLNIFNEEIEKLSIIANNLDRLTNKLENPFSSIDLELTKANSMFVKINSKEIKDLTLEEELLGISQKEFIELYKEMYGFNDTDIEVLWQLKVGIYNCYGKENGEFYFNYIMGRMYYNPDSAGTDYWVGKGFDVILGDLDELTFDTSSFKSFLAKISGLKIEQINDIYYKIRLQHTLCGGIESIPNRDFTAGSPMFVWLDKYLTSKSYSIEKINEIKDNLAKYGENSSYISILNEAYNFWNNEASRMSGKMDFVHYSITTATVLCPDEKSYFLEQVGEGFDDESGWYGDVYGFNLSMEGSINQIDYISDLDAENIVSYMKENNISSLDVARQKYLENIKNGSLNRAEYFKKNNPEVLDFIMEEALNNYTAEKNRNNVPPSFTSPEAQRAYNDSLKQKNRLEFEKLSCDEKMKYVKNNAKDFAYSLLTNRNELIDYEK